MVARILLNIASFVELGFDEWVVLQIIISKLFVQNMIGSLNRQDYAVKILIVYWWDNDEGGIGCVLVVLVVFGCVLGCDTIWVVYWLGMGCVLVEKHWSRLGVVIARPRNTGFLIVSWLCT